MYSYPVSQTWSLVHVGQNPWCYLCVCVRVYVCVCTCVCVCVSHSVVSDSSTPQTLACHAPLTIEFSRQEYWTGLPFPSPGDLPNPGIEPRSPALQADSLPSEPLGKLVLVDTHTNS